MKTMKSPGNILISKGKSFPVERRSDVNIDLS